MTITPSATDINTTLPLGADFIKEFLRFGSVSTENVEALRAALAADCDWEGSQSIRDAAFAARRNYGAFTISQIQTIYRPIIEAYARVAAGGESNATDFDTLFRTVVDLWLDNGYWIQSRNITTDTSGSSSGTGNPTIRRLAFDRDGLAIETRYVAPLTIEAERVQPNTRDGEEVLLFQMQKSYDVFSLDIAAESSGGPGLRRSLTLRNRDNVWLKNASFETPSTAGSLSAATTIGAWSIVSGAANLAIVADGYRYSVTERARSAKGMLRATGDFQIRQYITSAIDLDAAYDFGVWVYPNATAVAGSGTIILKMGSLTETFTVSTLSAGAWQFIGFNLTTASLAKLLYGRNFYVDQPTLEIYTGGTWAGQIDFDAVEHGEFTFINGTGWNVIPGSTPVGMSYYNTFTDAFASADSVIQKHMFLGFNKQLPHTVAATQVTASGGRTLTFANSGSADTITASSGSFVTDGYKAGMLVTIAGTSSNNMTTGPIATVSATVLTFGATTSLTNEGPLSATATLDATAPILDP